MSSIVEELKVQLKQAMKDADSDKKSHIRSILSKITEYSVEHRFDRTKPLPDEEAIKVISALKKSLEKALEMFKKGGEDSENEIVQNYRKEIAFCEQFLPEDKEGQAQVETWITDAIAELGVNDVKQVGRVIGHIMKNHKDEQPDGALVKKLVMQKLARVGD